MSFVLVVTQKSVYHVKTHLVSGLTIKQIWGSVDDSLVGNEYPLQAYIKEDQLFPIGGMANLINVSRGNKLYFLVSREKPRTTSEVIAVFTPTGHDGNLKLNR